MLKTMMARLKRVVGHRVPFDPSTLDDPVAMHTDWTPAKSGGASFRTHKLVPVHSHRMELRASSGAKLFYLAFLLIGLGVLVGFSVSKVFSGTFSLDMETVMPLLVGLVFAGTGGAMLFFGTAPIVFDKRKGFFWKGRTPPDQVFDTRSMKYCAALTQIHAIQLLSEYCRGNKTSYYSYEMNLVLENGQRINVVDHGSPNALRDDARSLSRFLEKPVWDAI